MQMLFINSTVHEQVLLMGAIKREKKVRNNVERGGSGGSCIKKNVVTLIRFIIYLVKL